MLLKPKLLDGRATLFASIMYIYYVLEILSVHSNREYNTVLA